MVEQAALEVYSGLDNLKLAERIEDRWSGPRAKRLARMYRLSARRYLDRADGIQESLKGALERRKLACLLGEKLERLLEDGRGST